LNGILTFKGIKLIVIGYLLIIFVTLLDTVVGTYSKNIKITQAGITYYLGKLFSIQGVTEIAKTYYN